MIRGETKRAKAALIWQERVCATRSLKMKQNSSALRVLLSIPKWKFFGSKKENKVGGAFATSSVRPANAGQCICVLRHLIFPDQLIPHNPKIQ